MKDKSKAKRLSEKGIDDIVEAQADNPAFWEGPIHVRVKRPAAMRLSPELAARAAFFARLHHASSVDHWLQRIIKERIDFEEAAFSGLKRDLTSPKSRSKHSLASR